MKAKRTEKTKKSVTGNAQNALLEVGVEEIPARFMPAFLEDLRAKAEKELKSARLGFKGIRTFGTARRLILFIEGISSSQDDISEERKGPPRERAFDQNGNPTQACVGFAKSIGIVPADLRIVKVSGKEYVSGTLKVKGQGAEKVLPDVLVKVLGSLYLPISMKWGEGDHKFVRPVHWIAALLGSRPLDLEFGGIRASGFTYGHRHVSGSKPLRIATPVSVSGFKTVLSRNGVIADQDERKASIKAQVAALAREAKGSALIDDALLCEVAFLTEIPTASLGSFDADFLKLPKDILITSMKKNQKYFPIIDGKGGLMPSFVVVTDCPDRVTADSTVAGNEKVLRARLADAKFFFDEDIKAKLDARMEDLKKVSFHEKLGSMFDKSERVVKLSHFIAKELKLGREEISRIERAASLSKADLVTKMVFEFPELQGIMGREYSLHFGEDGAVSNGIFEHYLPRFSGDDLPKGIEGAVVGLADRIDTIVGYFSIGLIPTGSEDPYALRRLAQGVVEIVLARKLDLILENLIEHSYKLYEEVFVKNLLGKGDTAYQDYNRIRKEVLEFLAQRLKGVLISEGVRYDVADAVLSDLSDIVYSYDNAKVLMKHVDRQPLVGIVMTADRIERLARGAVREQVIETDLADPEERKMYDLYMKVNWEVGEAIDKGDNEKAVIELGKLTGPVEVFFDKVLVMDKDEKLKANRLALLRSMEKMFRTVADFPKIVVQKSS